MKPSHYTRPALLLSLVLALPLGRARADDSAPSAPPPAAPDSTPADGTSPAPAPAHHRRMRPGYVLADLTAKLNLTPDQQKAVGKVIADGRAQMKELHGDDSIAQADKRAKMREIATSTRGQIRAALTPEQQKLFDAMPTKQGKGAPEASAPPAPPAQQ